MQSIFPGWLGVAGNDCLITARIRTRKNRNALRTEKEMLCLEVTAAPVDNQANQAVVRLLAQHLKLPRSRVKIVSGARAARKRFRVTDIQPEELLNLLEIELSADSD